MRTARVHIMMGSISDENVVSASGMVDTLREILGDHDVVASVCSAHRNAADLAHYVDEASENGAQIFIGVAGLAAALPGALAGASRMTKLVIAVPLDVHGIDSCLYMPPGVPVALVGVGKTGLTNAALLTCQALGIGDGEVGQRLHHYLQLNAKKPEFDIDLDRLKKPKKEA